MSDTGLVWIREDFRIENNAALSYATQNHQNVIAFYIYNNNEYDNKREAQKWWLSKSLENFKKDLFNYQINLQILKGGQMDWVFNFELLDEIQIVGFIGSRSFLKFKNLIRTHH